MRRHMLVGGDPVWLTVETARRCGCNWGNFSNVNLRQIELALYRYPPPLP